MARMESKLRIGVPTDLAYSLWSSPEEFPNFMRGVVGVHEKGKNVFQVETKSGSNRDKWTIEVHTEEPHRVRWTSRGKGRFQGEVVLRSILDRSEVWLAIDYEPHNVNDDDPVGRMLHTWDVGADLLRFKIYAEGVLEEAAVGV